MTPGVFERLSRACPICRQDGGAVKAGMNRYTIIKDTLKILEESCDWKPEYKDEVELMRLLVATTRGSNVGAGHYTAEGETAVERFMDMEREMIVDRAMAIVGSLALTLFGLLMIVLAKLFDQAGFTDDPSKLNPIFNPYM